MDMNRKYNRLELATGFLMGSLPAFFLEVAFLRAYNAVCSWSECGIIEFDWWMLLPFPLIIGVVMAIMIASLHLEDY